MNATPDPTTHHITLPAPSISHFRDSGAKAAMTAPAPGIELSSPIWVCDKAGHPIRTGNFLLTPTGRIFRVIGPSPGGMLQMKSDAGKPFPDLLLCPEKVRECRVVPDPAVPDISAAEPPIADRYVDQLDHLVKSLAPVLDYHKSVEMTSFSRGDVAAENLHRNFVAKLSDVFHHLEANLGVARIIARTGGAQ